MENKTNDAIADERLENLPLQTENPAFAPDQLTACGKCGRSNAPTRASCLYCGAALEITEAQSKFVRLDLRPLESWEKGFNLILTGAPENFDDAATAKIAALLRLEAPILQRIIESKKPLPVARVETRSAAEIIQKKLLETANVETKIIADEQLNARNPPRRLRAMDFTDDRLVLVFFNGEETAEIAWTDLVLIVTGAIFERRVETTEARAKGGDSKLLEQNETASDEILIDVYSRDDSVGFRVEQQGFDFSCLAAEKGFLAAENLRALVKRLRERAPHAKIVEDYMRIRAPLSAIWAVEEQTESRGLKRDRFAKFNRENVTTITNATQFAKYSRLQRQLL